ncbi:hypothetical protein SDRG_04106 [Saprolegnia diclina VS20]|uniref:Uncharacterized protein n=1 Tax=Saprolegnia diclina (strain VS20) TaxID=1156394 RepID=T0QWJ8_SAPDV|nr:hypothetical protein SDRG_04106 [Saprolegnia diclina VS20]EQC38395.1 hypothetical protein SDRG_04106 [Saprolegnia diclina VS20]|eukprot:XP_008607987.1 hypothetical protein SDRG_04106 [Saprolegnia diclina VS20]
MCSRTTCGVCQKPTWSGCGMHIESALRGVDEADRCAEYKTGKHKSSMFPAMCIISVVATLLYVSMG